VRHHQPERDEKRAAIAGRLLARESPTHDADGALTNALRPNRAAFSLAPLQELEQELHHLAVLQRGVPGEGEVSSFETRLRLLEVPGEGFAIVPAFVEVLFQTLNSQVAKDQFHGPDSIRRSEFQRANRVGEPAIISWLPCVVVRDDPLLLCNWTLLGDFDHTSVGAAGQWGTQSHFGCVWGAVCCAGVAGCVGAGDGAGAEG
jgi:hypothetical protein